MEVAFEELRRSQVGEAFWGAGSVDRVSARNVSTARAQFSVAA